MANFGDDHEMNVSGCMESGRNVMSMAVRILYEHIID
jgi:hypothetical protein